MSSLTLCNSAFRPSHRTEMIEDESDAKDLEIAQQRQTIVDLKLKIHALEKESDDLVLQNAAEKDAVTRESNCAVEQMSASLIALQREMTHLRDADESRVVTRQHLERLTTEQSEERAQFSEWLTKQKDIEELTQQNEYKDVIITETNAELQTMTASLSAMQMKLKQCTECRRSASKEGMLIKVQGQSMEHLRLGRKSRKRVFFAGNRLFWSDSGSSTFKSIEVREVLNRVVVTAEKLKRMNNESIQKHTERPWFLIIGQRRCALFEAENKLERDEWVRFMRRALRSNRQNMA